MSTLPPRERGRRADAAAARRLRDRKLLVAVLGHQHAILTNPSHWTQVALARTALLEPVLPLSDLAWRWSLSGALAMALFEILGVRKAQSDWQRLYDLAVDALWTALPADHPRTRHHGMDLDGFNDYVGTDHADVVDLIDRALGECAARPSGATQ